MTWGDIEVEIAELFDSVLDVRDVHRGAGIGTRKGTGFKDPHRDADRFIAGDEPTRDAIREEMRVLCAGRRQAVQEPAKTDPVAKIREWQKKNVTWQRSYEAAYRERNREKLRLAAAARRSRAA